MSVGLNPSFTNTTHRKQKRARLTLYMRQERQRLKREASDAVRIRMNRPIFVTARENPKEMIDGLTRRDITRGMAGIIKRRSAKGLSTCEKNLAWQLYTENQIQTCAAHAVVLVLKGQI